MTGPGSKEDLKNVVGDDDVDNKLGEPTRNMLGEGEEEKYSEKSSDLEKASIRVDDDGDAVVVVHGGGGGDRSHREGPPEAGVGSAMTAAQPPVYRLYRQRFA